MPAFPFDIVAFDLDGTLADTIPDIAGGINRSRQLREVEDRASNAAASPKLCR